MALVLTRSRVRRGLGVLERDEVGELHVVEVQAWIALARCARCGRRVRVLPCDVLAYKHYSVLVIGHLVSTYTEGGWTQSLRSAAWGLLGERTPSHTTLHGWSEGLGAHALGLALGTFDGAAGGWAFSRVLAESAARYPQLGARWGAEVWVAPVRYRSDARRERLAAVVRVVAVAATVGEHPGGEGWARWSGLIVRWSGSFGLRFPSRLWCTRIEHVARDSRPGSRARSPPSRRRCPIRTRSPPGASSKSHR